VNFLPVNCFIHEIIFLIYFGPLWVALQKTEANPHSIAGTESARLSIAPIQRLMPCATLAAPGQASINQGSPDK
jgi:hypothetical protein